MRPTTSVRKNPRKKLPPRNTPDSFCRRFTPTKSIAALLGRYFSLWETYLENFISRPNVILTFRQRRCTNRGRNFVRSKRRPHYMSRAPLLIFCVLTIRKHLLMKRFERSGRGQEPSRGHKFSILENFLSIRDFTSAMRPHFRSDLVGACLPQTLLRTDEEELCQFDAIPPTYREKQSVPDGERPIVHIAIVCGLWQGASYSGTHPVFILSLHRLFEIPPSASRIRIVSRF